MSKPKPIALGRPAQKTTMLFTSLEIGRQLIEISNADTPGERLCVAVIEQAFNDAIYQQDLRDEAAKYETARRDAEAFLLGENESLALWCEPIGLEPAYITEIAIKAGYITDMKGVENGQAA